MGLSIDAESVLSKLRQIEGLDYSPAIKDACLLVEREAKEKAPVASGDLRRSIESKVMGNEGEVGTSLFYAPYVEYGTGIFSSQGDGRKDVPWFYQDVKGNWHSTCGMKPRPFLIPSYENNRGNIKQIIAEYVREKIND